MLAIDLAANQIPAMALGSERAEPGTMSRPPRPRSEHQTPGLDDVFHTSDLSGWEWLFLAAWPPILLGAEELRKAVLRRRAAGAAGAASGKQELIARRITQFG